jgi:hypothetical protein
LKNGIKKSFSEMVKMEKSLSKIKDVDKKILSELDDQSLLEFCKSNKYGNELCKDELFWKQRFINRFGRADKNTDRSWKDFYLNVVFYMDKYRNQALARISMKGIRNIDIINFLLIRGYTANQGLIGASAGGHKDLVEYYVSRGANDFINGYLNASTRELRDHFRLLGVQVLLA